MSERIKENCVERRKKEKEERDFYGFSRRCSYKEEEEERSEQTKSKGGLT